MVKIIKFGTIQKTTCKECGCLFSFEEEDLKPQKDRIKKAIDCPQCGHEIVFLMQDNIKGGN